jgi:hypothetical protein
MRHFKKSRRKLDIRKINMPKDKKAESEDIYKEMLMGKIRKKKR